jgi:phthalate 4,5-dioxygenase
MFVPIDDNTCWRYQMTMHPDGGSSGRVDQIALEKLRNAPTKAVAPGESQRYVEPANDYLLDREDQKTRTYTGIPGTVQQDLAVTESMGSIYDRSQEHLGQTDLAIIRMRNLLVKAAKDMERGIEPPAILPDLPYREIRSAEKILEPGEDWRQLGQVLNQTAASTDSTSIRSRLNA